jgi:hypothetical protein
MLERPAWVRLGPTILEVAIVYPDVLRELHFEFRRASALMLGPNQYHRVGAKNSKCQPARSIFAGAPTL